MSEERMMQLEAEVLDLKGRLIAMERRQARLRYQVRALERRATFLRAASQQALEAIESLQESDLAQAAHNLRLSLAKQVDKNHVPAGARRHARRRPS